MEAILVAKYENVIAYVPFLTNCQFLLHRFLPALVRISADLFVDSHSETAALGKANVAHGSTDCTDFYST
jgi:hypothetical protein